MSLRDRFLQFRGSNGFLYLLCALMAAWFIAHLGWGYDEDKSTANFWMSFEASFTTCLLVEMMFRSLNIDRATMARIEQQEVYIRELEEQILAAGLPRPRRPHRKVSAK